MIAYLALLHETGRKYEISPRIPGMMIQAPRSTGCHMTPYWKFRIVSFHWPFKHTGASRNVGGSTNENHAMLPAMLRGARHEEIETRDISRMPELPKLQATHTFGERAAVCDCGTKCCLGIED